MHIGDMYPFII